MKSRTLLIFFIHLWSFSLLSAQETIGIPQMQELIISIRLNRGDILYREDFNKYNEAYTCLYQVSQQRELSVTEKSDLDQLYRLFDNLNQKSAEIKPFFNGVFEARDNAVSQAANDYAPEKFEKAEKELRDLVKKFSFRNPDQYQKNMTDIIRIYREAEYEAVRNKLLSEVRILIRESEDLGARSDFPVLYERVTRLFSDIETILAAQNYDDPSLGEKADRLLGESRHLLYICQVYQQIQREDTAFEQFVLRLENQILNISEKTGTNLSTAEGLENMLTGLQQATAQLQNELVKQQTYNKELLDSIATLNRQLDELQSKLNNNRNLYSRVETMKQKLSPHGVRVFQQDQSIILRINGIDFPLGKLQMNETDRSKLEKVGESLRMFPDEKVLVRLGQKTNGNPQYTRALAEERVKAVALIIQSSGYIEDAR